MGLCHGKSIDHLPNPTQYQTSSAAVIVENDSAAFDSQSANKTPNIPFYSPSPFRSFFKNSPAKSSNSSVNSTPLRFFKRPFPPPSPAKHIKSLLARRHGSIKPNEASIPEGHEVVIGLDKSFGYSKQFNVFYELGEEVGRGHFGYTCLAKGKKGSLKGQDVAVKVIPKSKVCCYIYMVSCL